MPKWPADHMLYIEGRSARLLWEVHALRHDALRPDSLREGALVAPGSCFALVTQHGKSDVGPRNRTYWRIG